MNICSAVDLTVYETAIIVLHIVTSYWLHGETRISVDMDRINEYLTLSEDVKERLAKMLETKPGVRIRTPPPKLDFAQLPQEYQNLIDSGQEKR